MKNSKQKTVTPTASTVSAFAPLLLRDGLLDNLLGVDYANITYWAGKELARQFPAQTIEELQQFFTKAAWGDLTILYQDSGQQQWSLTGPIVQERLAVKESPDFSLETGFLAQQLESQSAAIAEGSFSFSSKKATAKITILTDLNSQVTQQSAAEEVALRDRYLNQADEIELASQTTTTATTDRATATASSSTSQASQAPDSAAAPSTRVDTTLADSEQAVNSSQADAEALPTKTDSPADSQTASDLTVDQSITDSLLARQRARRAAKDQHASSVERP
ncbi:YslB family protein [Leuconostocaceae bacterium ESL0958]|nr:YslB family protein [Leuconostocaceae bacterium ESL0958]